MRTFCWIICLLASVVSFLVLAFGLSSAESAPQEAAIAAISAAIVIIPYVFARAIEGFYRSNEKLEDQNDEIISLLKRIAPTEYLSNEDKAKLYDQMNK